MAGHLVRRVHEYLLVELSPEKFPEGTHLNPRLIAEELDVSRTTVNKALQRLVECGIARRDGGRLIVVTHPGSRHGNGKPTGRTQFDASNESTRVYHAIRERMLHGGFAIGRSVNAKKLAADLGTTIQAVRQALNEATAAGMFERRPRRGWIAVRHSAREIQDIYRVRLAFEPFLIRVAVPRIPDERIDELATQIESLQKAGDISRSVLREADYQFHRAFMDVANRRILTGILDPMIHKLFLQPSVRSAATTFSEHAEILEAVRARDAALAAERLRAHLQKSRRSYVSAADAIPGSLRIESGAAANAERRVDALEIPNRES